jgi:preprotein translocase subunit SecG
VDIILLVLHVFLSLGIITLVLLQKGAGASAGASFGGGGGGSVFGATGASNFLSKTTAIFATAFFINSLVLAYMASNRDIKTDSVIDALTPPAIEAPADISTGGGLSPKQTESPTLELDVPAADTSMAIEIDEATESSSGSDVPTPASE